jgi:hypothetical protein
MKLYLACMKKHGNAHHECRAVSRQYLDCRMHK